MAIIHERLANVKRKPTEMKLQRRLAHHGSTIIAPDGAQILQVRAGTTSTSSSSSSSSRSTSSTSRSSSTSSKTSSSSRSSPTSSASPMSSSPSHHLPITKASGSTSSRTSTTTTSSPTAIGDLSNVHKGTPAYVPALAAVFSVLGVVLFALLLFFCCKRRKKAAIAQVEAQKREKWGVRWRQRGQDSSDSGSPLFLGAMGGRSRSSTSSTFLSPRDTSLKTDGQLLDAPTSPSGWGPFHITPYRVSFTVRVPASFKTAKAKQATTTGPKDLVLPSKPSRFYDRRSPPAGSQVSIFTRPSFRSQPSSYFSRRTETTPPPSYNSRIQSGRSIPTIATNGSVASRSPPNLPPVLTGPALNITAAPMTGVESPDPYQPIPSAIFTPLSQVVTFPTSNLPLPRGMVVISTFTPALSDELNIKVGEGVKMLEEYDDGWCLVERDSVNGRKPDQGAVPRFCLDEILSDEPGTAAASVRSLRPMTPQSTGPFRSPTRKGSLRRRKERKENRF
ncbi:hypothetical protein CALCODRAFT_499841 [Calocera cornea HHB12733]|uniref:SH3 domain-containing protein n=1 Tax=Calocera cornea HHB12733 TaxID=1353952 RepID=A0A165E9Z9_9BASI|nr:hypothetical protein CALCODRAFT_499841 [Calocera cornea HHB12733]